MSKMCTVVHAPAGSGMVEDSKRIMDAYGCTEAIHVDVAKEENLAENRLVLCNEEPVFTGARFGFPVRVVTYKVAMEMVKIDEEGRA